MLETKEIVIKDSWPWEEKGKIEVTALDQCRGMWGVPTLVAAHRVLGIDDKEEVYVPHGAVPEEKCDLLMNRREAEEELADVKLTPGPVSSAFNIITPPSTINQPTRQHMRLVFSTDGTSLTHASSPAELLEAVVHALIGEYSLENIRFKRSYLVSLEGHWNYFKTG